jgi:hypothetical protein
VRLPLLAAAFATLVGTGCVGSQVVIDGYPIGEMAPCADADCSREIATAVRWLDRVAPDHPEIDHVELHLPDYRSPTGSRYLMTRSGGRTVVAVLAFADGSRRAVQVGCGIGVSPVCFTAPPGVAPPVTIDPSSVPGWPP